MSSANSVSTVDKTTAQSLVIQFWDKRQNLSQAEIEQLKPVITQVLQDLDDGHVRIAEKTDGQWVVHDWLKKAVIMSFGLNDNALHQAPNLMYDKVPLKFVDWSESQFKSSRIRAVPGHVVRHSAYIAADVILMPSFVNLGAYIDSGTMIDTWATVGACAQVGKNCHISGGVGLGGVLEPLQANPVIIEDDCFIGARSEVVEGVIVEKGSVIGMGVFLGASTPIVNRATGETTFGRIPAYSVVIAGTLPGKVMGNGQPGPGLACAVIVKQVDAQTRSKTAINELLRPN